jgi:hypothetical protein
LVHDLVQAVDCTNKTAAITHLAKLDSLISSVPNKRSNHTVRTRTMRVGSLWEHGLGRLGISPLQMSLAPAGSAVLLARVLSQRRQVDSPVSVVAGRDMMIHLRHCHPQRYQLPRGLEQSTRGGH